MGINMELGEAIAIIENQTSLRG